MAFQTGLEGKPWYYGAALGLGLGALLVVGGYYLILTKQYDQIAAKDRKLAELQVKINEGRSAKQRLPQFREEVRRLELELDKLLRILPSRRNTPELLRRIRQLTEQGNFDLLRFTPGNFIDRDFYSEWPITIRVNGSYHNLALFFDRVSRFSRIINIENLRVNALAKPVKAHTIHASFVAKTFIYKDPATQPPPPPPGKGTGKGGRK
jgi:Tfp pilus assembly protein PilO